MTSPDRDPYRVPAEVHRFTIEEVKMVLTPAGKNLRVSAICNHILAGGQLSMGAMHLYVGHRGIGWFQLVAGVLLLIAGQWMLRYINKHFRVPERGDHELQ